MGVQWIMGVVVLPINIYFDSFIYYGNKPVIIWLLPPMKWRSDRSGLCSKFHCICFFFSFGICMMSFDTKADIGIRIQFNPITPLCCQATDDHSRNGRKWAGLPCISSFNHLSIVQPTLMMITKCHLCSLVEICCLFVCLLWYQYNYLSSSLLYVYWFESA